MDRSDYYFSVCVSLTVILIQEINVMPDWLCSISIFIKGSRLTELQAKLPLMKNNHTIKQNKQTKKDFNLVQERPLWIFALLCFHLPLWLWQGYWKERQLRWCFEIRPVPLGSTTGCQCPISERSLRSSNEIALSLVYYKTHLSWNA